MSIPAQEKTWEISANEFVGSDEGAKQSHADTLLKILNRLLSFENQHWVCLGSSDATTGALDGTNRLLGIADFSWNTAPNNHSWFVVKDPVTNIQLCISCDTLLVKTEGPKISLLYSASAGFTGGTVTARPTAADELGSPIVWLGTTEQTPQFKLNLISQRSTDGQCTRIILVNGKVPVFYLSCEKFKGATTVVTSFMMTTPASTTILENNLTYERLNKTMCIFSYLAVPGYLLAYLSARCSTLTGLPTGLTTVKNEIDNTFFIDRPEVIANNPGGDKGKLGEIYDLFWAPGTQDTGTLYNYSEGSWIQLGHLLFPWDSSITLKLE